MRFLITALCLFILVLLPASPGLAITDAERGLNAEVSTPAPPEQSGIGLRLLDIPTAAQEDPRARSYIVDRLAPGTVIERRIQVQNDSDSIQSVRIYPGAAHIEAGSFIGEDDPAVNELTSWTSVDQERLDVAPGGSADVTVTIDVPADAPEGEQYAAIWAEVRSTSSEGANNIIQASRVGIRMYLSVGPGNGKPADFSIDSLTSARDELDNPKVTALITNTGGRALDITGDLTLSEGPGGLSAGPFTAQQATTIAPGGTGTVAITLDPELPDGPWNAQVALKSGLVEHTAEANLTFPEAGQGQTVEPAESPGIPWIPLGAAAAVLAMLAALVWRLRQRKIATTNHQPSDTRQGHRQEAKTGPGHP
ncbi:hypothetical protein IWX75_003576 [Arthrobacter sp. CAN_A6]|uniref:hypothetical protein n=1 Tax=Arthrobacter sp. CAN_A6 TaxID=2787721 RepID=UPI0018C9385D